MHRSRKQYLGSWHCYQLIILSNTSHLPQEQCLKEWTLHSSTAREKAGLCCLLFAVLPADKLDYQTARPNGFSICWQKSLKPEGRKAGRAPVARQPSVGQVWGYLCSTHVLYLLLNSGKQDVTLGSEPFKWPGLVSIMQVTSTSKTPVYGQDSKAAGVSRRICIWHTMRHTCSFAEASHTVLGGIVVL